MSNISDSTALPTYEEMMNIFADLDKDASVPSGTQPTESTTSFTTYEAMMNIFADLDEDASVPSATQSTDCTKSLKHSNMEKQQRDVNTCDSCVRFEDTHKVRNSSARAFAKQKLAETSSDAIPAKLFDDSIALNKKSFFSTRGLQTDNSEDMQSDEHERLPTCEDMLCIFADLESSEASFGESTTYQKPRKMMQDTTNELYMGTRKLHGDRVSSQRSQDGADTPSSVMIMDLFVCK